MRQVLKASAAIASALLFGCSGTETGNPGSTASVALAVHSSSADISVGPGAGGVHVESAWLKVSSATGTTCDPHEARTISSGFVGDLVSGGDSLSNIDLGVDPLCALEFSLSLDAIPPAGAPPELETSSVVLTGTRSDGVPFLIAAPSLLPITLQAAAPVDPTGYDALLLAFDLAVWLEGTVLDDVVVDAQGVARLDGVAHPASVMTFQGQIAPGAALYPDLDADGVLDPEDLDHALAQH